MSCLNRLTFTATDEAAELLPAYLAAHVPHGWEEKSLPRGEVQCIVHSGHAGFCEELVRTVAALLPGVEVCSEEVEEENWAEAWKEFFTPVEGGDHFLVLAPWMERELATTSRIPVIIEPKTAFGTGHHATTALCLDILSGLYEAGHLAAGARFLDLGTGSGILGIAAAKLGCVGQGVDIDQSSVDNALENRTINSVPSEAFSVGLGSASDVQGPFDLVMANILAGPLCDMAADITGLLAGENAFLVLSGILDIQADGVEAAYRRNGLGRAKRLVQGEWVALIFRK